MPRKPILIVLVGVLAICTAAEAADLTLKAEMKQVVEPVTNTLFAVGGEADPENGPDAAKVSGKRWKEAADAADVLVRAAVQLNAPGFANPDPAWAAMAKDMQAIGERARTAAATRNGKDLAQAANDLGDNCSACHAKFKPQTGD